MSAQRSIVALGTLFIVFMWSSACIQKSGSDTDPEYQPCENILCGETCSVCAPNDPDCVSATVEMICNGQGMCVEQDGRSLGCDAEQCVSGSTFESADGCNTCQCPANGRRSDAVCTARDCNRDSCEAGAVFDADDGCNVCRCPDSGLRAEAACTTRDCSLRCEPGTQFTADDGCNTCTCPDDGQRAEAACTERVCAEPCDGRNCGAACVPQETSTSPGESPEEGDRAEAIAAPSFQCDIRGRCVDSESQSLHCDDRCFEVQCGQTCLEMSTSSADRLPDPDSGGFPGVEICNAEGMCVWADSVGGVECPSVCDGLDCGELCDPDNVGEASSDSDESADRAPAAEPPEYRCDNSGRCVANWDPSQLMCE